MAWWETVSVIAESAATVAVAGFAIVQLRRERQRERQQRVTIESRTSTVAFLLRRQLRSWLGMTPERDDGLETWLREAQNAQTFKKQLDTAEARLVELAQLAAEASPQVATRIRQAYVLFLAGTGRLNEYAATPRPAGAGLLDWTRLRTDAEKDLQGCLAALENGPINAELLHAEVTLDELRDSEDPFQQLADAMLKQVEAGQVRPQSPGS